MFATGSTAIRPSLTQRANAFSRAASACWYGIAHHFARRTAIKSLGELTDRELRDIGIERSQIEAAVHGFVDLSDRMRL